MDLDYTVVAKLPPEVLNIIFQFMDLPSQRNSRLVCRRWYEIVNLNMALKVLLCDDTVKYFRNMTMNMIDELRVCDLKNELANCQSTTRSAFSDKNVHSLIITGILKSSGVSEANIKALFRVLRPCLRRLVFEQDALWAFKRDRRFLSTFQMDYLSCLQISIVPILLTPVDIRPYIYLFNNRFPNLMILTFKCDAPNVSMKLIIKLYKFICEHYESIRSLKVTHTRAYMYTRWQDKKLMESGTYENLIHGILKLKLTSLAYDHLVECFPQSGARWQNLESSLIHNQTTLSIFHSHVQYPLGVPDYKDIIQSNQNTLEDMYILTVSYPVPTFDCQWVEKCPKLTVLNLCIIDLSSREMDRQNYFNIGKLPKTLMRLTFGTTLLDWEVDWIVSNLIRLREICYCMKWKNYEKSSLMQFKKFIRMPEFSNYVLLDWKCPMISQCVQGTPGLEDKNLGTPCYTDVYVDRRVFNPNLVNND